MERRSHDRDPARDGRPGSLSETGAPSAPTVLRRFRWSGTIGALTLAAALGLQFAGGQAAAGSSARPAAGYHAVPLPTAPAGVAAPAAAPAVPDDETAGTTGGSSGPTSYGGMHGTFSLYDGVGGGIEFWFDPNTGKLTVAIGAGVGEGGEGSLGYYVPGSEPAPGLSDFVNASFAAGTIATVNAKGTYSWDDGKFDGEISATIAGRTLSISSTGAPGFTVSTCADEGAAGFTGSVGLQYVATFDVSSVQKILDDIFSDSTAPVSETPLLDALLYEYEGATGTTGQQDLSTGDSSDDGTTDDTADGTVDGTTDDSGTGSDSTTGGTIDGSTGTVGGDTSGNTTSSSGTGGNVGGGSSGTTTGGVHCYPDDQAQVHAQAQPRATSTKPPICT